MLDNDPIWEPDYSSGQFQERDDQLIATWAVTQEPAEMVARLCYVRGDDDDEFVIVLPLLPSKAEIKEPWEQRLLAVVGFAVTREIEHIWYPYNEPWGIEAMSEEWKKMRERRGGMTGF